jgi:hypothetical protein
MTSKLHQWLSAHRCFCFILLTISFLIFGKLSLDLVRLFSANAAYLLAFGWMGLVDGGLLQLIELIFSALGAMAAYLIFKLCENVLIAYLAYTK